MFSSSGTRRPTFVGEVASSWLVSNGATSAPARYSVCHTQARLSHVPLIPKAFTDLAYERVECIDCGDDVVSVIRASGTATSSGIAGEVTYAQVETWRARRVVSIRYFVSRADALEAVGLRE